MRHPREPSGITRDSGLEQSAILNRGGALPRLIGGGLLLFPCAAIFPLAYKFSEGAGSDVTLVTLPGAHLIYQAFGKSDADTVAAVPATPHPFIRHPLRALNPACMQSKRAIRRSPFQRDLRSEGWVRSRRRPPGPDGCRSAWRGPRHIPCGSSCGWPAARRPGSSHPVRS